ncbi:hypothetical protein BX666DRAFT_1858076 [Dichotomocladium elegans]|nr:hypothetical protein BX666DRAFT_1858076 [Dichotomocladium elegans]
MKFSFAATTALLLTTFAALGSADEYADAIKAWCKGLDVTTPSAKDVLVAGHNAKITVTRIPDSKKKTITGLDLYSVSKTGKAKYVQNVWTGNYTLNSKASITDKLPSKLTAGLYYYRVWVTNILGGAHGPDCIETSHTFKVTTGVHTNSDGISYYTESLDDIQFYHPEYFKGCFALEVDYPKKDQEVKLGEHVTISVSRDTTSQTDSVTKVDLYKSTSANEAEYVETVWEGRESFTNQFTLKDHFKFDESEIESGATYYYALTVTSSKTQDEDCTFHSQPFKVIL